MHFNLHAAVLHSSFRELHALKRILFFFTDMKVTQIMKLVGAAWQELDEGEKAKYHKLSEEDKTRYEEEKDAFLAAGGDADALTKKPRKSKK